MPGPADHSHPHVRSQRRARSHGVGWLPLYDVVGRWAKVPAAYDELVSRFDLADGSRVLEIGCGTGTLLVRASGAASLTGIGLDPDRRALTRLRRKATRAGVTVTTDVGVATVLPYADGSIDQVLSALMLHHVEADDRPTVLAEVRRVLAPGGRFQLVDLDAAEQHAGRHRRGVRGRIRHHDHETDLAGALRDAGFEVVGHPPVTTRFGRLQHVTGRHPARE